MNITFDNISLNTAPYLLAELDHEKSSSRDVYMYDLTRERGSIFVGENYKPKEFIITGRITGANKATLETNIDAFKELMSRAMKNLDLEYSTGTRRYVAVASMIDINRKFFHLSFAPFTVTLVAPSGVGEDITQTVLTQAGITTATYNGTAHIDGSAYPKPTIKMTVKAASAMTAISFQNNGDKVVLTNALVLNDVVIFDCANKKVTLNGAEKDYTGIFPEFIIGDNAYQLAVTRTTGTIDLEISYAKKYL